MHCLYLQVSRNLAAFAVKSRHQIKQKDCYMKKYCEAQSQQLDLPS